MRQVFATALVICGLATPAFAYGTRHVEFDPAAEVQRATGAAQYPESNGGVVREGRANGGGSNEGFPAPTRGVAHNGTEMLTGGNSRYPVMTPDMLSHPPTALSQDGMLTYQYEGGGQRAVNVGGGFSGDAGN